MPKLTRTPGVAIVSGIALAALSACGLASGAASPASGNGGTGSVSAHRPSPSAGQAGVNRKASGHDKAGSRSKHAAAGQPSARSGAAPLAGKIVGIDPGHNGRNNTDPSYINHRVWNGREWETCDTTGTATDGGYPETQFTFRVARLLRADLRSDGARVVMTRANNQGVGPCVNRRAKILNRAHANVAIDIHADGGPSWGRGFSILEPVKDGPNNKIIKASGVFGRAVRTAMRQHTNMPVSNYYGHDGIQARDDLAGLNLATEPKVLIESGNMRNRTDARLLTSTTFQEQLARALTAAIVAYLTGHA